MKPRGLDLLEGDLRQGASSRPPKPLGTPGSAGSSELAQQAPGLRRGSGAIPDHRRAREGKTSGPHLPPATPEPLGCLLPSSGATSGWADGSLCGLDSAPRPRPPAAHSERTGHLPHTRRGTRATSFQEHRGPALSLDFGDHTGRSDSVPFSGDGSDPTGSRWTQAPSPGGWSTPVPPAHRGPERPPPAAGRGRSP